MPYPLAQVKIAPIIRTFLTAALCLLTGVRQSHSAEPAKPAADAITWTQGESYFRQQNRPVFLLGRNATGTDATQFDEIFQSAARHGETLMRIHLTVGRPVKGAPGEVDEAWVSYWENIFDLAAKRGLVVLPVFGVWADWNDGSAGTAWHAWSRNPYNRSLGGPAHSPAELLADGPCQTQWLAWLEKLVRRWQSRENIAGWEIFSELDLITGARPQPVKTFVERAAAIVRAADSKSRPVTVSLSGIADWPEVFGSRAIDFTQVHPYADAPRFHGDLDDMIIATVRGRLQRYGKPVLIGECGLDSRTPKDTLTTSERAGMGINHAVWAAAVSGALTGRMLWWEDGYDRYSGLDLRAGYEDAATPVAQFIQGVNFANLHPVEATVDKTLHGAALGNEHLILGWFRDSRCHAPAWPVEKVIGATVSFSSPCATGSWRVQFYDPKSGKMTGEQTVPAQAGRLTVSLPNFEASTAFKLIWMTAGL